MFTAFSSGYRIVVTISTVGKKIKTINSYVICILLHLLTPTEITKTTGQLGRLRTDIQYEPYVTKKLYPLLHVNKIKWFKLKRLTMFPDAQFISLLISCYLEWVFVGLKIKPRLLISV